MAEQTLKYGFTFIIFKLTYQTILNFRRSETMARDIDYIVHATSDSILPINVSVCTITAEVSAWKWLNKQ